MAIRLNPRIHFTTRTNQKIAETSIEFIRKYKTPPGVQLELLLEADIRRGDDGRLLVQTLQLLKEQSTQLEPAFILEQLDTYLEIQRLQSTTSEAMEALHRGDLTEAKEKLVKSAFNTHQKQSSGIWLHDTKKVMAVLDKEEDEFFPVGIPAMENMGVVMARKTLTMMIAPAKHGKSWWLIACGKAGIQHHKDVLHITLENSEELTARRYLQSIFALTKNEAKEIKVPMFTTTDGGMTMDYNTFTRESVLSRKKEIRERLEYAYSWGRLHIKEFPSGTLTSDGLSLYCEQLEQEEGFKPDEIVLDYADLMRIDKGNLRIDTGRTYVDLRGIASARNAAMATASQGNRDSDTAKVVDRKNVAEDWSKIGTVDLLFTYSRTQQEKQMNLARVLCAGARDAADRVMVLVSQSYDIGQFCIDSTFMSANVAVEVGKFTGGSDEQ